MLYKYAVAIFSNKVEREYFYRRVVRDSLTAKIDIHTKVNNSLFKTKVATKNFEPIIHF